MKSFLFAALTLASGAPSDYHADYQYQYQQDPTAYQPSGYGSTYQHPPSNYQPPPSTYHQPPPPTYTEAPPAEYQPEYQPYKPEPKYADPKEEWDQFWANTELCKAEFGLRQCLLDCSSREQFFHDKRVSQCVVQFVRGLCGAISTKAVKKCENGRVSITTDNCQTSAYADAILQLDRLAQKVDFISSGPLGDPWSLTAIALSIEAITSTSDCVTEAFFYYLSQCAKKKYLNPEDITCVEKHLTDHRCLEHATHGPETIDLQNLLSNLDGEEPSDELIHWVKKHYGEKKNVAEAIRDLLNGHAASFSSRIRPMSVAFSETKLRASIDVCPYNYIPMNFGYPDFEGIPAKFVAFHFPRDATFREVSSDGQIPEETLLKEAVAPEPVDPPAEPVWDPKTPKYGIAKTCKKYYDFSKVIYQLADYDTGDMCYTIDGYKIKFLETGNSEKLDYEWIDRDDLSEWSLPTEPTDTLLQNGHPAYYHHDRTEAPELEWFNVALNHATCYTASWRAQKTCTSHLSEWQMSVQCCKSYASTLNEKKYPSTYNYHGYEPVKEEYAPHPYEPAPKHHDYYDAALLKEDGYPADYTPPADTYQPHPYHQSYPAYSSPDPKSLVYTKVVSSNVTAGVLGEHNPLATSPPGIDNTNLVNEFYSWVMNVNNAVLTAENKIATAENDAESLKELLYELHHKKWQRKEGLVANLKHPSVYHYIGGDHFAQATCEQLNIDLDFDKIVPLQTGICYPQSCLLAQYSTCVDNPLDAHKTYNPYYHYGKYPQQAPDYGYAPAHDQYGYAPAPAHDQYGYAPAPAHDQYGYAPAPAHDHYGYAPAPAHDQYGYAPAPAHDHYGYAPAPAHDHYGYAPAPAHNQYGYDHYGYRALLSSETGSFAALSAAGFVAGIVVVALVQLIVKRQPKVNNVNMNALI